ncbi:Peroxisomal biogenesis factor 8 [Sugiyamaella lignohabitans]|uniref:Peroxisomal biogenesis factor 8 n=1 Tax=Sugiyamaella lignohabitans TaxID=796027 RepID=A0A167EZT8_9ASCO|nr:Peroxisomal biogenesis factor 8 [Sugiyamaella lignohabitans]ANB14649.1 Peroxisomal biogenesis factor 8 [Sugiyamaella lignohabitans]
MSYLTDITQVVDSIVRELQNSSIYSSSGPADLARRKALIGRAIQYLPSLRNEHNVPLLALELLSSPVVALPEPVCSDFLVDGFRSAVARKYSISDPTIPPQEWTKYLVRPVIDRLTAEGALWRILPLLSGLIQASKYEILADIERSERGLRQSKITYVPSVADLRYQQDWYVRVFNQIITLPLESDSDYKKYRDIINMALITLAKCQWALDPDVYSRLVHAETIVRSLQLIYSYPDTSVINSLRLQSSPVIELVNNLLGGFSNIIRQSVESNYRNNLSFNDLDLALNHIHMFAEDLSRTWVRLKHSPDSITKSETEQWQILKQFIFAICLQLQGFAGLLLHVNRPKLVPVAYLSAKILKTLSPVYFILDKIGSATFEPFSFTYNVCIDVLTLSRGTLRQAQESVDSLIRALAGSCNLGAVLDNDMDRGKILFLIDLFEKLIHFSSFQVINQIILPFIGEFLVPNRDPTNRKLLTPLLESSHSVMLQYLRLSPEVAVINDNVVMNYLDTLLALFPHDLSSPQLLLALKTIAQSVAAPTRPTKQLLHQFLERLYFKCKITLPAIPLTTKAEENGPPTVRSVFVSSLIHSLPLLEPGDFQFWLERTDKLFLRRGPYYSPLFQAENEYLTEDMEKMISGELDLSLADIGIRWWHHSSKL